MNVGFILEFIEFDVDKKIKAVTIIKEVNVSHDFRLTSVGGSWKGRWTLQPFLSLGLLLRLLGQQHTLDVGQHTDLSDGNST